jgi:hypothetical protein
MIFSVLSEVIMHDKWNPETFEASSFIFISVDDGIETFFWSFISL